MVVSVGIDVSKDKHDCFIVSAEGKVLADVFTVPNNMDGFHCLLQILMCHKVTHKKLIDNSPLFRKNFKVEFHGSHTNCVASFA